ncbi:glycoside hydrolase superfamily [Aspergillus avenaceus]|uniref:Glycoside hydrolase superfamily n=1 Tax=Aspergillus avenaceus TaxID=36643 RepID=A0A5N6U4C6_ASPAV|nr:glycoside hydrolase superfamily [Aspergillus avenaceus]
MRNLYRLIYLRYVFCGSSLSEASAIKKREPPKAANERVRLHDGWRFRRYEEIPDNVIYDFREDADGDNLHVLKPWILPTANDFIKNPDNHHTRPTEQPDVRIEFAKNSYDDSEWANVTVPHDWAIELPFLEDGDTIPLMMGQLPVHGVGWYRRTLEMVSDDLEKVVYLDIDGGMSYSMVWVNEHLVGGWPFGYNSFRLDITSFLKQGKNSLAIRVENPRGPSSRWYPGAGLYRNVWLTKVHPTHVAHWGTFITSNDVSPESATVDLAVQIENKGIEKRTITVTTQIYEYDAKERQHGEFVAEIPQRKINLLRGDRQSVNGSVRIKKPRLWGPPPTQFPHLYVAMTRLWDGEKLLGSYETQFGIRSLQFDPDKGLLVNNEHVYLQGVNQHHDLGALGAAFNQRAAERQLEILQEMGTNAIRMSHNPPAPELLDLTDRMGFLVIDEVFDSWLEKKTDLDFHLIFEDWYEADLRSVMRRDRNHPSVFMWSYGNEVPEQNDEMGAQISSSLRAIAHAEDHTRPTSFSLNTATPNASITDTADIINLNYQGEGIRYGPAYNHLTEGTKKTPQYDAFHEGHPDKLILGSEVASALSLRGSFVFPVTPYNSAPVNDTSGGDSDTLAVSAYELYTAQPGSAADRVFKAQDEHSFVAGGFVWAGWDYIGEPYWCETCRSGYYGIIDLAGFKKERFWLYQAHWKSILPMAHIIPHWNWPDREGKVTPVHVFTSGDEAELFVNGNSQGRLKRESLEYRFRWDNVTYEPGEVHAVTYKDGKKWATDTVRTTGAATGLRLTADRTKIASDGEDISFVTLEVVDPDGHLVPDAAHTVTFSVSGAGNLVATDNGFPADMTAFTSARRKAFNGLCLGIVSATAGSFGTISVKAESEGLEPAEIILQSV